MNKLTKVLFALVGVIMPILIGGLHTYVHFKDLTIPEVESYLQKPIEVMGESVPIWNSWGVMSVMMGVSFIVIGLLNISILKKYIQTNSLPLTVFLAMIIYLVSVIYVGHTFNAMEQFYGGIFGIIVMVFCFVSNYTYRS